MPACIPATKSCRRHRNSSVCSGLTLLETDRTTTCKPFGTLVLIGIITGYLMLGGCAFWLMEKEHETQSQNIVNSHRADIVNDLVTQLTDSNISAEAVNLTKMLDSRLLRYHAVLYTAFQGGMLSEGDDYTQSLSFFAAYVLALTIITSIGYGNIVPRSPRGQIFCIFYAIFGIPLFLLFLGNLGSCIASWVRRQARKILRLRYSDELRVRKKALGIRLDEAEASTSKNKTEWRENWTMTEKKTQYNSLICDWVLDGKNRHVGVQTENSANKAVKNKKKELWDQNKMEDIVPWMTAAEKHEMNVEEISQSTDAQDKNELDTKAGCNDNISKTNNLLIHKERNNYNEVVTTETNCTTLEETTHAHHHIDVHDEEETISFIILILLFLLYVIIIAFIVQISQPDWSLLECIYFSVITMTTIGFGDYVLDRGSRTFDVYVKPLFVAFFIIVGLMILSALFNTAQDGLRILGGWIEKRFKCITRKVCGDFPRFSNSIGASQELPNITTGH